MEFKDECQTRGVFLLLAAPEHQEMNGKFEVTWRTLRTVSHSLIVHARFLEVYVHFALMYTTDHIFPFLLSNNAHKLAIGMKPSVSHLRVLFFSCVVRKSAVHVEGKTLNMRHQAQKWLRGIFFGIPQHRKGYLVYVPSTRKMISSYDVVFDESFSSALAYTSRSCSEAIAVRPSVTYTPYAMSSEEQTGDVITFAQFEEGEILTKTLSNAESGDESNNKSIMIIEQDMDAMNSGGESDHDLISTDILEDIPDGSQTHPNVNRREAQNKIRDRVRQRKS